MYYRMSIVAVWVATWVAVFAFMPAFHPRHGQPFLITAHSGGMAGWAFYCASMAVFVALLTTMSAREKYVERRFATALREDGWTVQTNTDFAVWAEDVRGQCEGASITREARNHGFDGPDAVTRYIDSAAYAMDPERY
jgi:hypothetical protein